MGSAHNDVDQASSLYSKARAIRGLKGGYRPMEGLGFSVRGRNLSYNTYVATSGVMADGSCAHE